ncbi:MAG: hypothetical protein ABW047_05100 [Nitrospiraceae bacterium]
MPRVQEDFDRVLTGFQRVRSVRARHRGRRSAAFCGSSRIVTVVIVASGIRVLSRWCGAG